MFQHRSAIFGELLHEGVHKLTAHTQLYQLATINHINYSLQNYICGHIYQHFITTNHYYIVFYHFNNS